MFTSIAVNSGLEKVPVDALLELASSMDSKPLCIRLAGKLGFGELDISKWNNSVEGIEAIALDIVLKWSQRTGCTGEERRSAVEKALLDMDRLDLYDIFTEKCDLAG